LIFWDWEDILFGKYIIIILSNKIMSLNLILEKYDSSNINNEGILMDLECSNSADFLKTIMSQMYLSLKSLWNKNFLNMHLSKRTSFILKYEFRLKRMCGTQIHVLGSMFCLSSAKDLKMGYFALSQLINLLGAVGRTLIFPSCQQLHLH
jgi:hypothetical protein